ncbi:MAG: DUF4332 domain-containing protein [Planctomycetaceae bacterium]|nr:DUF4332 domain-containing protein [Planctomycetaceae bacterium]
MRLKRISITRPGTRFAVDLSHFQSGFNVVYGTNGTGKSTTWNFLRETMFNTRERRHAADATTGFVDLQSSDDEVRLRWNDAHNVEYSELIINSGKQKVRESADKEIHRFRDHCFRQLFFSCLRDQADFHDLLESVRRDGISLDSQSLMTRDGKWTLKNRLCPQDRSFELQQAETRLRELRQELTARELEQRHSLEKDQTRRAQLTRELDLCRQSIRDDQEALVRIQQELNAREEEQALFSERNCQRTQLQLEQWRSELDSWLAASEKRLRAEYVKADLDEEIQQLRLAGQNTVTPDWRHFESSLVDSVKAGVHELLQHSEPCTECGRYHLDQCDPRWSMIQERVREHSLNLHNWADEHCLTHCRCELDQEVKALEQKRAAVVAWIATLTERIDSLPKPEQWSQWTADCQGTGGWCGCHAHDALRAELSSRAHRVLPTEQLAEFLKMLEGRFTRKVDTTLIAQLRLRQKELLQKKTATEQEVQRLTALLHELAAPEALQLTSQEDSLLAAIAEMETRVKDLHRMAPGMTTVEEVLERLNELKQLDMISPLLTEVSRHLCSHSDAKWRAIRVNSDNRKLEALSSDAIWHPWESLSCGTQQFVSTMLRLGIAREYRARGIEFPILLDDVLADHDYDQQQSAIQILSHYAEEGQQIIYLTCHQHIANSCAAHGAHVLQIFKSGEPKFRISAEASTCSRRETALKVSSQPPIITETVRESAPLLLETSSAKYPLEPGDPISRLKTIGTKKLLRLQSAGIETIDDLIQLRITSERTLKKLGVSTDRMQRWQSTARLLCCVPGLRFSEARLLAACGVQDAESLAQLEEGELQRKLESLRTSEAKSFKSLRTHSCGLDEIRSWQRSARNRRQYPLSGERERSRRKRRLRTGERLRNRQSRQLSQHTRRERSASDYARQQQATRNLLSSREPDQRVLSVEQTESADSRELRHFLSMESPIVEAPSIGPKTAKRFHKIGIKTVRQFLNADPDQMAEKINARHIPAQTLREWQAQARLMCCVPEVRGHDVQILVACGIDDVPKLARHRADDLLELVLPFANTTLGKRILRSGKTPDLEEVQNWIAWSQQSRRLDAA